MSVETVPNDRAWRWWALAIAILALHAMAAAALLPSANVGAPASEIGQAPPTD